MRPDRRVRARIPRDRYAGGSIAGTIVSVSVTKWFAYDPDIGTPVVHEYGDPAMAEKVVHFVGRQRGNTLLPLVVRHLSAEHRLANILVTAQFFGFPVYQSQMVPVISVSDMSAAELETAFARGLNRRGPVEPWAVVLDRPLSWHSGFRPVVYAEAARIDEHRAAPSVTSGRRFQVPIIVGSCRDAANRDDALSGSRSTDRVEIRRSARAVVSARAA